LKARRAYLFTSEVSFESFVFFLKLKLPDLKDEACKTDEIPVPSNRTNIICMNALLFIPAK
jgi:hypothetical protein